MFMYDELGVKKHWSWNLDQDYRHFCCTANVSLGGVRGCRDYVLENNVFFN